MKTGQCERMLVVICPLSEERGYYNMNALKSYNWKDFS